MDDTSVSFIDGVVVSKKWIVVAARPNALTDEEEGTRVFTLRDSEWLHYDLDMHVRSVCAVSKPPVAVLSLGRDGRVYIRRSGQGTEERIPEAGTGKGKLGYLHKIRQIGDSLYACGVSSQIYQHSKTGWGRFDDGVLDRRGPLHVPTLFSIDGISYQDIYSVGQRGLIWHYNGKAWNRVDPVTLKDLTGVRCSAPDAVYVCGKDGTLLTLSRGKWDQIQVPSETGHFWAIEFFEGKIYLAASKGLYCFDGNHVQSVDTGLDPAPDGHRLHANDGVLWSFGVNHLCFFDGKKWTYVKHPDNP